MTENKLQENQRRRELVRITYEILIIAVIVVLAIWNAAQTQHIHELSGRINQLEQRVYGGRR